MPKKNSNNPYKQAPATPTFKLNYQASPTLAKFHSSDAFMRGVRGPIGSGKSVGCCLEIFIRASKQEPSFDGIRRTRWAVVRNTGPELETTTIKTWLDWFPEAVFGKMNRKPPITHRVKIDDIELEVIFLALDRPEDEKKLLSLEVTGIFFNEARGIHKKIIDAGTGRVGRYPSRKEIPDGFPEDAAWPTWYGIIMDTNPPDDDHWWYDAAETETPKGWEFWSQPSGLAPEAENIGNLPKGYYDQIAAGKSKEWVNVFVHGKYGTIQEGKPVYNQSYRDELHCVDEVLPIPGVMLEIGIDYGNTPAALITQISPTGQRRVLEEVVTVDTSIQNFAKILLQILNKDYRGFPYKCYGDPAGEFKDQQQKSAKDLMRAQGIIVASAPSNQIKMRVESVSYELDRLINGQPAFLVNGRKCPTLKRGFNGGYRYRQLNVSGGGRYEDKPEKNQFSHIHDACQYVCLSTGSYRAITRGNAKSQTKTVVSKSNWSVWT